MTRPTLEGQTIGKYRVLEGLGRGGMAQVYRAYHAQLNRYAAIKVLRSDLADDEEFLGRFQREARVIASLRHHNIVHVFDFDRQDDIYYLVMELLEGDSLRERLIKYRAEGDRMPLPEVIHIIKDVLAGLGYAHSQGLIHRDIKPANIMLTNRDEAVLTDFGIAQIIGGTQYTISGALMGTLSYMAPEQGLQGLCDQRSDLYSLGIVLFEMLTGFTPFDGDTPLAILMKHLHDPLPLPRQIDPAIPESFEKIVLKALAKDPADRYQTCQEMTVALERIRAEDLPDGRRKQVYTPNDFDSRAVFSGIARQKITDLGLAKQETDPDLAGSLPPAALSNRLLANLARPVNTPTAVLAALGMILLVNFFASMSASIFRLNLYERGWPFELFLVAGFLAVIMWAVETHWLLIPIGILLGNTLLLAYSSISARWGDWIFLWMLEPLIIGAAIYFPIRLRKYPSQIKFISRAGGVMVGLLSVFLAGATCILALASALLRSKP
jgi:tRNA A-37 threonylcarbamoyl transferase component Bud32